MGNDGDTKKGKDRETVSSTIFVAAKQLVVCCVQKEIDGCCVFVQGNKRSYVCSLQTQVAGLLLR